MALAKLSIDLEARLANLQAGLDKAGLLAERQAERMQRAFSGASKALTAAGIRRPAVVLRGTLHPSRVRRAYLAACAYQNRHWMLT